MSDPIRIGGLMRCCTQTIRERDKPGTEGEKQPCRWCSSGARFRDGAWEWNWRADDGDSDA